MKSKQVTIHNCEECPNVYLYLSRHPCCILKDKKPCNTKDEDGIPDWCPLEDTKIKNPLELSATEYIEKTLGIKAEPIDPEIVRKYQEEMQKAAKEYFENRPIQRVPGDKIFDLDWE